MSRPDSAKMIGDQADRAERAEQPFGVEEAGGEHG